MENTPLLGLEHHIYRRDGMIRLHRVGAGEPVLFLHSVGTSGESWDPILDKLSRQFSCYVVDLPGHDHSDIPPRKYSLDDYAESIIDVIDATGLQSVNIVGSHTGAMISAIVAASHPERVSSLVLDGLPYWNMEQGKIIWERWFSPMYSDTSSYHIPVVSIPTWEEAKTKNQHLTKDAWKRKNILSEKSRLWWRWSQEANSHYDMPSLGPKIKAPTLLLFGDADTLRRTEDLAHRDIVKSIHKVIENCPGQLNTYQPAALADAISLFLTSEMHTLN